MAVPSSGELNMLNMAREALYGTWGSGTITGPISLYDLVNGGNTNGSGNSYPTINDGCEPNPASRSTYTVRTPIYKYNGSSYDSGNTYYTDVSEVPGDYANGDTLYTDAGLTTPVGQWDGNNFYLDQTRNVPYGVTFTTNSSGVIANLTFITP